MSAAGRLVAALAALAASVGIGAGGVGLLGFALRSTTDGRVAFGVLAGVWLLALALAGVATGGYLALRPATRREEG